MHAALTMTMLTVTEVEAVDDAVAVTLEIVIEDDVVVMDDVTDAKGKNGNVVEVEMTPVQIGRALESATCLTSSASTASRWDITPTNAH